MLVPNKHGASRDYRYGFNGKENDNEIMGEGNFEDYGMRMYNPRIGRFFNVDPLTKSYPELTPYQFASNTPIQAMDLDGLEKVIYLINYTKENVTRSKIELSKAGPLGDGAAVQLTKNGATTNFYGEELKSVAEFTKAYEGDHNLTSYYVGKGDNKGNLTGGYGHELSASEKLTYLEGTKIPQKVADSWFSSDWLSKQNLVARNLKVSGLSETQTNALVDFGFNIKKAPSRIASFTTESGADYFLGFMKGGGGLAKRRIGESILYSEGKYFKFNEINAKQEGILDQLIKDNPSPSNDKSDGIWGSEPIKFDPIKF